MKSRDLYCKKCGCDTTHENCGGHVTSAKIADAYYNCTVCHSQQTIKVDKDDYLCRPPKFRCEECEDECDHSVSHLARGQKQATVVLHCAACNHEVRKYFPLDEIPERILHAAEPPPSPSSASESSAA